MVQRKINGKGLFLIALLAASALITSCAAGGAQSASEGLKDTISVVGYGESSGVPDTATVQLGVSIVADEVASAIDQSNATIAAITAALSDLGIPAEDIQTTNFNVWPDDSGLKPEGSVLGAGRTYRVDSTLQVRVSGVDKVGQAIEAALDNGANNIYGLNFSIDDTSDLVSEARAKAIDDAKERAGEIADALGVSLGEPVIIAESSGSIPQLSGYAVAEAALGGGGLPLSPGQTTVSAQISITFAISR